MEIYKDILLEEERRNILKFVKTKVKELGEKFPGLQSDPNLHTLKELKVFLKRIKKYLTGYKIQKCWANYSCGDYISFHKHKVTSMVYFLENKSNMGPMFLKKSKGFFQVNMSQCPENSLLIFDSGVIHSVPCHLKEDRYSIAIELIK
mgnify:CR=1 FL=1